MNIRIDTFHGIQPRLHPSLLADGMAVRAHNCRLKSGKLVPLRLPSIVGGVTVHREGGLNSIADAKSHYCWKHTQAGGSVVTDFIAFEGIVDFAEGNLADDPNDRLFVSGQTGVPFTDSNGKTWPDSPAVYFYSRSGNSIRRRTICKTPLAAPSVSIQAAPSDAKTVYYVYFFASWVDSDGYESGLSAASSSTVGPGAEPNGTGALMVNAGQVVTFEQMSLPADADKVRIYVTSAGSSDATDGIQFFAELTRSQATTAVGASVTFVPENLGESEPGIESPPGDLAGLHFVSGGYYTAYSKSAPHSVMFSDIGIVTSWPVAYRYDVKDNIVALATTSNTVFALTDGWPWVLTGTAPESMTVAKLAGPAACVSPRGVCVYRNSVYFASNEGLMAIVNDADAGTVCTNLTQKVFTKEQWLAMNPKSCLVGQHDGALHIFFWNDDGTPRESVVVDLAETADAVTTHCVSARCVCVDARTDRMYFVGERGV